MTPEGTAGSKTPRRKKTSARSSKDKKSADAAPNNGEAKGDGERSEKSNGRGREKNGRSRPEPTHRGEKLNLKAELCDPQCELEADEEAFISCPATWKNARGVSEDENTEAFSTGTKSQSGFEQNQMLEL